MSESAVLYCAVCGRETLHSVLRPGGQVTARVCRDPEHNVRLAAEAIVTAARERDGGIDATELEAHPAVQAVRSVGRIEIVRAVDWLEAQQRVFVLRETGDKPNPFPFSRVLLSASST